ncbi:LysR family transcriptional regulator [Cryptosporangium minutisporangium]|uniref:LysR substrate-binding domain-containing protein n=1 Tax=Cryptosporangium minutisporangium TaxID=113569 RepID=A0ABP6T6R7_9ACTN
MSVELRLMRYVVTVAETGSFQAAADRLRMSQPPLSRQIRDLERQLGTPLFTRRPTRLTEAGTVFVESARQVLADAELVVERTRQAGLGLLRVGYTVMSAFEEMPALYSAMQRDYPRIRVEAREAWDHELTSGLADGSLDAVLGRLVTAPVSTGALTLRRDPLVVVVGAEHRLAAADSVSLHELRGDVQQFFPRHLAPRYHDAILTAVRSSGENIEVWENPLPGLRAAATNLSRGGFMVLPAPIAHQLPGVRPIPIRERLPDIPLQLTWRRPASAVVGPLLQTARRMARTGPDFREDHR